MDVEFLKYRFEDGYDGVIVKQKFKIGVRHVQMVYMLLCTVTMGALRGSNSIALLAMSDHTRINDTYIQIHYWDRRIQGKIMSSFFFGYALMLVPAELFLKRVGGKLTMTVVLILNGAIAVSMPTITNRVGWLAVYNSELILGMSHACCIASMHVLLSKFLLPSERHIFSCIIYSGIILGVAIGSPISGLISETDLGWELIYYSQGMLALSMAAVWGILTAGTPQQHQAIGDTEKEYIKESLSLYRKKVIKVPWRSIFCSRSFWAVACAHVASNAVFVFFLSEMPAFFLALGNSLKYSSLLSIVPFLLMWCVHMTSSPTVDWFAKVLQNGFQVKLITYRKFINICAGLSIAASLALLPHVAQWGNTAAVLVASAALGLLGLQYFGFLECYRDMSENFPGSVLMMSSGAASAAGALVPLVSGYIVGDAMLDINSWRVLFLSLSVLYVACTLIFTVLGSSERQPWDGGVVVANKFGYHNGIMIDSNQVELDELNLGISSL